MKRMMTVAFALSLALCLGACSNASQTSASNEPPVSATVTTAKGSVSLADGTYPLEVETDSKMFRFDKAELKVEKGTCTAILTMPGEGFTRLHVGTSGEVLNEKGDGSDAIIEHGTDGAGKYTFEIPVSAFDEELSVAAYGTKGDKWYDHTVTFHLADATN